MLQIKSVRAIAVKKSTSTWRLKKTRYLERFWNACSHPLKAFLSRLVPAQGGPFFYTRSHFSALQNYALLSSTNFSLFSYLKNALQNLVIGFWSVPFFKNIVQFFINLTHISLAIELLTFCKNAKKQFYCSRELSLFWLNK